MREFKKWILEFGVGSRSEKLFFKHDLQQVAFTVMSKQRNASLTKTVFDIYRLDTVKNSFIGPIKKLCGEGKYREVISN